MTVAGIEKICDYNVPVLVAVSILMLSSEGKCHPILSMSHTYFSRVLLLHSALSPLDLGDNLFNSCHFAFLPVSKNQAPR